MEVFVCKECGYESNKWQGKCPACDSWNSYTEVSRIVGKGKKRINHTDSVTAIAISEIETSKTERIKTGIFEFDNVIGGGILNGMVALIGGEPGIGKSTLLLQISSIVSTVNKKVLYVSGEESAEQIKLRSDRLTTNNQNLMLLTVGDVENILNEIQKVKPDLIVIDSIQSVFMPSLESAPGSVSQLREVTLQFTHIAKKMNIPTFLIGHVTKEGYVAGPKIIEHMVDTVLYFEGETRGQFKILRSIKNRFGSTNEIGIFEMRSTGLEEVKNPSEYFLNYSENSTGTTIGCTVEGSRAFLIESQALVSSTSYGTPQRVSLGFPHKKLAIFLAIIEKSLSLNLRQSDVFLKLSGGMRTGDPSLDLSAIASIISSFLDKKIPEKYLFLGEVSLNGDVRPVSYSQKRINEAVKLGFNNIVMSSKNKVKKTDNTILINNLSQLLDYGIFE